MPPKLYSQRDKNRPVAEASGKPDEEYRSPWRRDYARVVHSPAFRRLQGKTQLFPGQESDFFRNRLTHSLEVAQIAKSIAIKLNATEEFFLKRKANKIDTDLVETAALCHDLGHPPFGHNGEEALDECMKESGGFEGNAQTLRILTRIEKRFLINGDAKTPLPIVDGKDNRAGLNLTNRTLAAILKYDNCIPVSFEDRGELAGPVKGYFESEATIVSHLKNVYGIPSEKKLRTLECCIMDIADDIAYSTYDLEDAFKAAFLNPLSMISAPGHVLEKVADTINHRIKKYYPDISNDMASYSGNDFKKIIISLFLEVFNVTEGDTRLATIFQDVADGRVDAAVSTATIVSVANETALLLTENGYRRARLTSEFVGKFINAVEFLPNDENPMLSSVRLNIETFKIVETLKNFVYQSLIMSPMLKVAEHRGKDIVKELFEAIVDNNKSGHHLMPKDYRDLYEYISSPKDKRRIVCDFISGMTDRYAVQLYSRLYGVTAESIYAPL